MTTTYAHIAYISQFGGKPMATSFIGTKAEALNWIEEEGHQELIAYTTASVRAPKNPYKDELSARSVAFDKMIALIKK